MDTTTPLPRRPRANTRARVMTAAEALLADRGFSALTMEAVADRAGVSKATVYRWWSNRAAVAMEVLLQAAGPGTPYLEDDGPLANLRRHVHVAADFLGGPGGPMLAGVVADAQRDPAVAESFRRDYLTYRRAVLIGLTRDAVKIGELRPDVDVELLADQLIAPFFYRLLLGHASIHPGLADHIFDLTIRPLRTCDEA